MINFIFSNFKNVLARDVYKKQVGLEWWSIGLNDLNRKNMNHSNNILTPFFNCMDDVKNLHVNLTKEIRVYISELQTKNENDKKKFN